MIISVFPVVVPRGGEHYPISNMSTISAILLVKDPKKRRKRILKRYGGATLYLVSKTLVHHAPSSSQGRVTIEKVSEEGSHSRDTTRLNLAYCTLESGSTTSSTM